MENGEWHYPPTQPQEGSVASRHLAKTQGKNYKTETKKPSTLSGGPGTRDWEQ